MKFVRVFTWNIDHVIFSVASVFSSMVASNDDDVTSSKSINIFNMSCSSFWTTTWMWALKWAHLTQLFSRYLSSSSPSAISFLSVLPVSSVLPISSILPVYAACFICFICFICTQYCVCPSMARTPTKKLSEVEWIKKSGKQDEQIKLPVVVSIEAWQVHRHIELTFCQEFVATDDCNSRRFAQPTGRLVGTF